MFLVMFSVMGLLLFDAFGGLAMNRLGTAAVVGDTWTEDAAGNIPWTWGLAGFAKYYNYFNILYQSP
jgi:hypothetical protein